MSNTFSKVDYLEKEYLVRAIKTLQTENKQLQKENVDLKEEIYELKRKIELQEIILQEEDAERRIR